MYCNHFCSDFKYQGRSSGQLPTTELRLTSIVASALGGCCREFRPCASSGAGHEHSYSTKEQNKGTNITFFRVCPRDVLCFWVGFPSLLNF
eukprot:3453611-Amphidinium_carterae.1